MSGRAGPTTCPRTPRPLRKQFLSYPTARSVQEYGVDSQNVNGPSLCTACGARWSHN